MRTLIVKRKGYHSNICSIIILILENYKRVGDIFLGKRFDGEGSIFKQYRWNSTTTEEEKQKKREKQKEKNKKTGKNEGCGDYFIWAGEYIDASGNKKRVYGKRDESGGDFKKRFQVIMDTSVATPVTNNTTVGQLISKWLFTKKDISEDTLALYKRRANDYIILHIGDLKIQEVTKDTIDNLIDVLMKSGRIKTKKGLSPGTIKSIKALLVGIFNFAVDNYIIPTNFIRDIKTPKVQKTKINTITVNDIKQIEEACKDDRLYVAFILDVTTGLRRGELLGLRWCDLNLDEGLLYVRQQLVAQKHKVAFKSKLKTNGSCRIIGIPQKTIDILKKYKEQENRDGNDLVICKPDGRYMHPTGLRDAIDTMLKKANVDHRKIHELRHSFATILLSNGAYVNEVQQSLGHSNPKTTLGIYGHILPGRQKEIASRMDNILSDSYTNPIQQ